MYLNKLVFKSFYDILSLNLSQSFKNTYAHKKIIARFFPKFNDLHQNFKGIPQSFANITGFFALKLTQVFAHILRTENPVFKLRAKNPVFKLRAKNPVIKFK